jgi:hypothetical protein
MTTQELRRRLWIRWFPYLSDPFASPQPSWQNWSWLGKRRPPRYTGHLPDRRRRLYDPRRQRH